MLSARRENGIIFIKESKDRWLARLFTRYPALVRKWARGANIVTFSDTPWMPMQKEIAASRIALITTGGVHLPSQASFDMRNPSGDASFREIPADTPAEELLITHNYYDHSDADRDVNILFPIERLRELEQFGEIGSANRRHFSFMGHITGERIDVLVNETVPKVVDGLVKDSVDAVILTPA
jgi:D-proline reductase (dithiol) PrdB